MTFQLCDCSQLLRKWIKFTSWYYMDCSPPGSSVRGILQARILGWVAISFSRGSSWPRDWTRVFCIAGRFCPVWAPREALYGTTFLVKAPFFFLRLSSLYLAPQIYSNRSRSESSWRERLLDRVANGILLLSQSLRATPSVFEERAWKLMRSPRNHLEGGQE